MVESCPPLNTTNAVSLFIVLMIVSWRCVTFKILNDTIADALVVDVDSFGALEPVDDADGEGEHDYFIKRFDHDLTDDHEGEVLVGDDSAQGYGEEDEGVAEFACDGGGDGTQGEAAALVANLHDAHYVGVQERSYDEGGKGGEGYSRGQTEKGVKTFLIGPVGGARDEIGQPA